MLNLTFSHSVETPRESTAGAAGAGHALRSGGHGCRDRSRPCGSPQRPGHAGTPPRHHVPPALNAGFPFPPGGRCHAPARGEAESAGLLSCACPEASLWGSPQLQALSCAALQEWGPERCWRRGAQRPLGSGAGLGGRSGSGNKATPVAQVVPHV